MKIDQLIVKACLNTRHKADRLSDMLKDKLIDKQTDITDRKNLPMIIDQRIVKACLTTRH